MVRERPSLAALSNGVPDSTPTTFDEVKTERDVEDSARLDLTKSIPAPYVSNRKELNRASPSTDDQDPVDVSDISNVHSLKANRGWQWTANFDRGKGFYRTERERQKRPSLVETGRKAGQSRVEYLYKDTLLIHSWTQDFFISAVNTGLGKLILVLSSIYVFTFFLFGVIYWFIHLGNNDCIYNNTGFALSVNFAIATQQTIGYGNTGPNDCWWATFVITVQTLVGLILDSLTIGIIFARISHPKNRGRTIGISDSCCISRRDGILKLMFRIADFRKTQVVEPRVTAYLYTWGEGRVTAEGEHICVRTEDLEIGYIDGMLLLPIIVEHTIDEQSPLCGHTHDSLQAANAEIIVTFEGTTEMGNPFMARQSYLPNEIHWGHSFVPIIFPPTHGKTHYIIDISKFHDVEPLQGLEMMLPSELSLTVVTKSLRTVPYPLLGENTLVVSDCLILAPDERGRLALMFRIGDTYPTQHLDVTIRAYVYRWRPAREPNSCGVPNDYDVQQLEVGYETGEDHLCLWLPMIGRHVITESSPLAAWATPTGFTADADSHIVVVCEGYMYKASQNRLRMRMYNVLKDVRRQHAFVPIVIRPSLSPDYRPRVNWSEFHETVPLDKAPSLYRASMVPRDLPTVTSRIHPKAIAGDATQSLVRHTATGSSLRTRPVPELEVAGPSIAPTITRARMAPMEMQQIALQPLTDPESHFRLRSVGMQRPRANFDVFEEGSSHGHTPNDTAHHRTGSTSLPDAINSVLGRLSRGSRGRRDGHPVHSNQMGAASVPRDD
ncbi:hypothetical protein WJX73_004138 [Symbiochloris irregularis]|uniref:Uncharacterized protein n=1 Tax=Symbiochloris irregularis TaxID=706552 RepID=A0AAW1PBD5_9CHLO